MIPLQAFQGVAVSALLAAGHGRAAALLVRVWVLWALQQHVLGWLFGLLFIHQP